MIRKVLAGPDKTGTPSPGLRKYTCLARIDTVADRWHLWRCVRSCRSIVLLAVWSPGRITSPYPRQLPHEELHPTLTAGGSVIYSIDKAPGVFRSRCESLFC
ncbi:hypothetical protein Mame01_29580 [Microbispora amethystogenes]|nr:hypothetical protein Mame01_29580 [Microbispora amethystogenes]